jgi:hypothetical protein
MSEQQIILEDKKTKKKRWQQIIDAAKEALQNNDNTKKGIIRKTAELLEKNGMPLQMICVTICRELHEFASKNYVTECLDSKYKDMTQSHPVTRKQTENAQVVVEPGNLRLPNDAKNVTEQKAEGEGEKATLPGTITEESNEQQKQQSITQQLEEQREKEEQQEFEIIRPEDYVIEDLPKYSSQLKDRIIIYLDDEVKRLTKKIQSRNS